MTGAQEGLLAIYGDMDTVNRPEMLCIGSEYRIGLTM